MKLQRFRAIVLWTASAGVLLLGLAGWGLVTVFPREPLGVTLFPCGSGVTVRFENRSLRPLRILQPMRGSESGTRMPHYLLTLEGLAPADRIPTARCGSSDGPDGWSLGQKWPDDYLVTILPGESFETFLALPWLTKEGRYRAHFTYAYDGKIAARQFRVLRLPDGLWNGTVSAPSIPIRFKQLEDIRQPIARAVTPRFKE